MAESGSLKLNLRLHLRSEEDEMDRTEFKENLGEAFHTGFRKATEHDDSHKIWELIIGLPGEDWDSVLDFVATCFERLIDGLEEDEDKPTSEPKKKQ